MRTSPRPLRLKQAPPSLPEEPLQLEIRCNACGAVATHEIGFAYVHPDLEKCRVDGWDGVYLGRIIVCKVCGIHDDYTLTADAHLTLTGQVLLHMSGGQGADEGTHQNLELGTAVLTDGTVLRRSSQGLALLREVVAKEPARAESWRRLGNLARRCGSLEEAEKSYRKAVELDEREAEAAACLGEMLWESDRLAEAIAFASTAIHRLCDSDSPREMRLSIAQSALHMVRMSLDISREPLALMASWTTGSPLAVTPVVRVSSVNLRELADGQWDRLAKLLADEKTIAASLTHEVPDGDERTQLASLLHEQVVPGLVAYSPSLPGKNRLCPCGSGKKRKVCCDRAAGPSRQNG